MEERREGFSRRSFLKGSAIGAMAMASAGTFAACSSGGSGTSGSAPTETAGTGSGAETSSWRTSPSPIADGDIVNTTTCDAVVVGTGFAGVTAFRELAEQGAKVILVEKQAEDTYMATGNEFAALNAKVLQDRGVPHIDPIEFFQNWMRITGNWANQDLIMKFAQNSEETTNWYLDQCTEEDLATMTTSFFPQTDHLLPELSGIKFWPSVCSFYGDCNQTKLQKYNRDAGVKAGGEAHWGEEGVQLLTDDSGAVTGIVTRTESGYSKYECKAVVLATGGFGGDTDMMADLMPDMYNALVEGEKLSSMSANDGAGVKMAYWAGAHLETTPIPGMNMKGLSVPGKMNCLPQAVWIDENGRRFCNEYYPTSEQRGLSTVYKTRKTKFAVVDDNFTEYRQYTLPQHAGFNATEENIASLREALDTAYSKFNGTYVEPESSDQDATAQSGPVVSIEYIADDTLEGLASQMGLEGEAVTNFIDQMAHWNEICAAGADDQYGRDATVLFPVDTPPFYACTFDPELGETMVTCGGIITDGEQNAVDKNYEPIPGLYVTGNDCGRRFGYEYITPIPGCSLGLAIVLGRECGKSVTQFLQG